MREPVELVVVVRGDALELRGMITVKDFQKASDFPRACKDERGRLRVADRGLLITADAAHTFQVGKRRFARVTLTAGDADVDELLALDEAGGEGGEFAHAATAS